MANVREQDELVEQLEKLVADDTSSKDEKEDDMDEAEQAEGEGRRKWPIKKKKRVSNKPPEKLKFHCTICDEHFEFLEELKLHFTTGSHFMTTLDKVSFKYEEVAMQDSLIDLTNYAPDPEKPLIGLGYIRELLTYDECSETEETEDKKLIVQVYRCFLCRTPVTKNWIHDHVTSMRHYKLYLRRHEKEKWEALDLDFSGTSSGDNADRLKIIAPLLKEIYEEKGEEKVKRSVCFMKRSDLGKLDNLTIGVNTPLSVKSQKAYLNRTLKAEEMKRASRSSNRGRGRARSGPDMLGMGGGWHGGREEGSPWEATGMRRAMAMRMGMPMRGGPGMPRGSRMGIPRGMGPAMLRGHEMPGERGILGARGMSGGGGMLPGRGQLRSQKMVPKRGMRGSRGVQAMSRTQGWEMGEEGSMWEEGDMGMGYGYDGMGMRGSLRGMDYGDEWGMSDDGMGMGLGSANQGLTRMNRGMGQGGMGMGAGMANRGLSRRQMSQGMDRGMGLGTMGTGAGMANRGLSRKQMSQGMDRGMGLGTMGTGAGMANRGLSRKQMSQGMDRSIGEGGGMGMAGRMRGPNQYQDEGVMDYEGGYYLDQGIMDHGMDMDYEPQDYGLGQQRQVGQKAKQSSLQSELTRMVSEMSDKDSSLLLGFMTAFAEGGDDEEEEYQPPLKQRMLRTQGAAGMGWTSNTSGNRQSSAATPGVRPQGNLQSRGSWRQPSNSWNRY